MIEKQYIVTEQELGLCRLNNNEKEVAVLVYQGFNNYEIAEKVSKSHHTVKSIISKILRKTGLKTRAQLSYLIAKFQYREEFLFNSN